MKPETRHIADAEVRMDLGTNGRPTLRGYAAVFNSTSEDLGGFREVIRPGAFSKSLMGGDIRALDSHDTAKVIGRTKAGTLRLVQDSRGLAVEIDPPDTSYARDLIENVRVGNVSGMSFRFYTPEGGDSWTQDDKGGVLRELRDIEVDEVSVVAFPAYRSTEVSVRSLSAFEEFRRSLAPAPSQPDPWFIRAHVRLRLAESVC